MQVMATNEERTLVTTVFGTVTDKRVIYCAKRSWYGGGSREDIPLSHVTSVRLETSRSVFWGIFLALIGLGLLLMPGSGAKLLGLALLVYAVLIMWGTPAVAVNTAGQDRNASKGAPWQKAEANAFVEALRGQLFSGQK
jgi:hypothetical protein